MLGAAEALQPLAQAAQQLGRTRAAAQRLWQVADERPAITFPSERIVILSEVGGSATPTPATRSGSFVVPPQDDLATLEFDHVDFAYHGMPVLREISFTLRPNSAVAIVGSSGAGKSTLLQLAARAWDPTSGQIRLDGRDLRSYPWQTLATTVGSVSQDSYMFSA